MCLNTLGCDKDNPNSTEVPLSVKVDFSSKYILPIRLVEKIKILEFFLRGCKKGDKYRLEYLSGEEGKRSSFMYIEMLDCVCSINMLPIVKIEGEKEPFMLDVSGPHLMVFNTREDRYLDIISIQKI